SRRCRRRWSPGTNGCRPRSRRRCATNSSAEGYRLPPRWPPPLTRQWQALTFAGRHMSRAAKIEDVASRAGVSVATVSRALRGLPHVSAATREKVLRAAEELDYRPNPHAARLAAGRSGTVGVAVPVLNSWFYANVLAGVEAVL